GAGEGEGRRAGGREAEAATTTSLATATYVTTRRLLSGVLVCLCLGILYPSSFTRSARPLTIPTSSLSPLPFLSLVYHPKLKFSLFRYLVYLLSILALLIFTSSNFSV
ncbi:hypothetical protein B0H14DRAFT_2903231, partial [Mycena olivaceomarginata]